MYLRVFRIKVWKQSEGEKCFTFYYNFWFVISFVIYVCFDRLVDWLLFQTKSYIVNDKERLVKSPESDEKQEKVTEKSEREDAGTETKSDSLGTLQFTVGYDVDKSTLNVSVICAKNLPVKNDSIGNSDPYVKLQLLPEKRQKVIN